ncbi:MAG TPA: exosortase-associated EpsI family protein [Roseimicrobium sp.]|nr:exosortase-associated EpsI family protein [Roseimicrobium sp.]
MNRNRAILLASALAIMGITAVLLSRLQSLQTLGTPGIRTQAGEKPPILRIELPETVPGYTSEAQKADKAEIGSLPADTSIGRRLYRAEDGFACLVSVVLMGTDRTSIHKPQFCLTGQGWTIDSTEDTKVAISQPHAWDMPVMKLTSTRLFKDTNGREVPMRGLYVYWFVADDLVTSRHWERMWWMAKDLVGRRVLQRWAYVSYFAACPPGQEDATFGRMKQMMATTVPMFQIAAGNPVQVSANTAPAAR